MAGPLLRVTAGPGRGTVIDVDREVVLGRSDAFADDPEISRSHARVTVDGAGEVAIEDLGSSNGTFVNGTRVQGRTVLASGDEIKVGTSRLEVAGVRAPARTTIQQRPAALAQPAAQAAPVARRSGERIRAIAGPAAGHEWDFNDQVVIGREAGEGTIAEDHELSRRHVRFVRRSDGALVVQDLDSTNGTYLNGWRFPTPQRLSPGDRIELGSTVLELGGEISAPRAPSLIGAVPGQRPADRSGTILYSEGVVKSYGDLHVLKGVDLEVQAGEVLGLLGPNGAGKSTWISVVAGLLEADAGTVTIGGVDALNEPVAARRHLGIAPQDLGIYPTMSVRRNLNFAGELSGLRGKLLHERVEEIGNALSLTPLMDRISERMSGGQKRRLHTGMAMLHHPQLLILDEPTVGADIRTRQEILDVVKALAADGRAVIYSTHYLPEIENIGASVGVLDGGKIIARGSIAELVAKHSAAAVELQFDGPPPQLDIDPSHGRVVVDDALIRIEKTPDPAAAAAAALGQLGHATRRLKRVDVIQPSLDAVYLALTERRYGGDPQGDIIGNQPPPSAIPAGYYPDPLGEAGQRLWDGNRWTTQTNP